MEKYSLEVGLHIEVVQDLTLDCFSAIKERMDIDSREILSAIRDWAIEFDKKYGTEFPDGDYLDKIDFFAERKVMEFLGMSKIEQRVFNMIADARFEHVVAFALKNGADYGLICDKTEFVIWITRCAEKCVKNEFLDDFCPSWGDSGLRVCSNCGKFMTEGYLLDDEYACTDDCGIELYRKEMYDADSENHEVKREVAEEQMRYDLERDDELCAGVYYWTEWEQSL